MARRSLADMDRGGELRLLVVLIVAAILWSLQPRMADAATGDPVLLNELLVSHTGNPDTTEFVELYGTPGGSLAGLSLVVVDGDGTSAGSIDLRVDFPADARLGGNGFFLIGNPAGLMANYGVAPDLTWGSDTLENGSQTIALAQTASLGAAGTVVTGSEAIRDAVAMTDTGSSDRWFWSAPVLGPDDGFLPAGGRRVMNGVDTDTVADWAFADDQLGAANTPTAATAFDAPPAVECGEDIVVDEGTAAQAQLSAVDPDGRVVSFAADVAPATTTITVAGVAGAATDGETATARLFVGSATVPGNHVVTVTAANDDAPPQTASCQLQVTVNDVPDPQSEPGPETGTASLWAVLDGMDSQKLHLLTDRLARIDRFLAKGQDSAAAAQLQALAKQTMGLSPRWLDASTASAFAAEADAMRATLRP
jgi:hypothetical protein